MRRRLVVRFKGSGQDDVRQRSPRAAQLARVGADSKLRRGVQGARRATRDRLAGDDGAHINTR